MTSILETLTIYELTKRRNDLLKQIEKIDKLIKKNNSDISPEEIITPIELEDVVDICPINIVPEEHIEEYNTNIKYIQPKIIKINIKKITKSANGDIKNIVEIDNIVPKQDVNDYKRVIKRIKIKK